MPLNVDISPVNIFATGQQAFGNAYGQVDQMRQDRARMMAGQALQSGDYEGAAAALAQGGDLQGAESLRALGREAHDRQANIQAATAFAGGDMTGAMTNVAQTGDIKNVGALRADIQAQHDAQTKFAAQEATKLRVIKDQYGPDAMLQAFDAQKPLYTQMGTSDDQIAQLRTALQSNPDAVLNALANPPDVKVATAGDTAVFYDGATGKELHRVTGEKFMNVNRPDGGQDIVRVGGGAGAGAPSGSTPAAGAPAALDPKQFFHDFVLPHEGGLNPSDMNGAPTKYGINQKANPQVDVTKLTPDQAADIFTNKYYGPSGAAKLPPALAAIHADTYFINPKAANTFLQQSGGDPAKYMQLRQSWMQNMVANSPAAAKYANAWAQRNKDLATYASQVGTMPPAVPGQGGDGQVVYSSPDAGESAMTPEAIDMAATRYAMTGQIPPMGMGKLATQFRARIQNRGAELIKEWGITPEDWVTGMAQFKVAQGSLQKITPMINQISASEATVEKNAGYALQLASKVNGPTGVPVLNRWIQAGRKNLAGDPDVAQLQAAIGTVADEYAKVMTTNTGSGGITSDAARNSAYSRINAAMTPTQLAAVIQTMKVEMANRLDSLRQQQAQLTNELRHGGPPPMNADGTAQPAPAAPPLPGNRPPLSAFQR